MNTDLNNFVTQYLSIIFGTFMSVSFVAFVSIPYALASIPL